MIITSDGYTFLQRRSHQTMTYPNMLGPSASGLMNMTADPSLKPNPFNAIRLEIQEELLIEPTEITDLKYLALTRELRRAGKPEMFFIARTSLDLSKVLRRFEERPRDARETEALVEIAIDNVKEPLREDNMSLAAKANTYFLLHYLKATKGHFS